MGPSSQPLLDPLVGSKVGRYLVQARVGEGGMGTVYRAEQQPLGRPVALKVIHRSLISDGKVVSRFLREAKIACQLTNPHTVTIFDFGNEDGVLYLAMELLHGESLHERLTRGPVEPVRAAEIAAQVCRSLTEAHKKGIIHRDLKPDNIFQSTADDGSLLVKVLDYGLARVMSSDEKPHTIQATLTQIGTIVGTPIYMSPEQARGRKLDARTDLYSMGVVLFEMLSGVAPFVDEDAVVVLGKHIRDPVPRIAESGARIAPPPALQVLVDKLLEKEPSKRPPDAQWVYQELRAYLSQAAGRSARMPAIEDASTTTTWGPPAASAKPARVSPPDAASGVQPRIEDDLALETEAGDQSRAHAAARRVMSPTDFDSDATVRVESPPNDPIADAPTPLPPTKGSPAVVPVSPGLSIDDRSHPKAMAAPLDLTAAPTLVSQPAVGLLSRRVPWGPLAIGAVLLAAGMVLLVLALGGGDEARVVATPLPTGHPLAPIPPEPAANSGAAPSAASPAADPPPVTAGEPIPAVPEGMTPRELALEGWQGTFRTKRGQVELTAANGVVNGRFGDGGHIRGTPEGSVLRFRWREGFDEGMGVLRSYADADGDTVLRGSWSERESESEIETWRVPRARPGKNRPTKRPAKQGLGVVTSDDIFGARTKRP